MSKLIVVLGATGGQGGSIVDAFLKLPNWRVRGLTRNASSEKAKVLATKGVDVVKADTDDQASLESAFRGANVIFAFTNYYDFFFELGPEKSMARELEQGSNLARAAAKIPTLERYVWSTLPNTAFITQGKVIVPHFQGKANVDLFIKDDLPHLYEKTIFTVFTIFAANLTLYEIFRPIYLNSAKKWIQFYPAHPETSYPSIGNHRANCGIFVRAVVENPPPIGTYVLCNIEDLTLCSFLAAWGRASGISPQPNSTAVVQISLEQYVALWGEMGEEQASQWRFLKYMNDAQINPNAIEGYSVVQGRDLMTEELKSLLVSTEEGMRTMDWSSYQPSS